MENSTEEHPCNLLNPHYTLRGKEKQETFAKLARQKQITIVPYGFVSGRRILTNIFQIQMSKNICLMICSFRVNTSFFF